jgi:hypothetical protein
VARYDPDKLTATHMPRDAVLVIDNAHAAQPADLARLARHAADPPLPAAARRRQPPRTVTPPIDGLALPWTVHDHDIDPTARTQAVKSPTQISPATSTATAAPTTASGRASPTPKNSPNTTARQRERDRSQDYGLEID